MGGYFCFKVFCLYNGGMNNYNTPNSGCCGRPFQYAPSKKCGENHCCFNDYNYKMNACIGKKQPDCTAQAVIPAVTIETVDGLTNYRNAFVHVTSINTTFYVDENCTPIITWAGNVETQIADGAHTDAEWREFLESFNLRSQFLYVKWHNQEDKDIILSFYYDNTKRIYFAGEFTETFEEVLQ